LSFLRLESGDLIDPSGKVRQEKNFDHLSADCAVGSARHNLSAAKTMGWCLSAFIDQRFIGENAQA